MLVTQSLVFIHLTKCGGTFVRSALLELDGSQQYAGRYHGPWSELPQEFREMPVITAVRNPYDWWVSWYHYMKARNWFNPLARAAVDAGYEEFPEMIQFILSSLQEGSSEAINVDNAVQTLINTPGTIPNDFTTHMTDHMRQNQCGILSWRHSFQLEGIEKNKLIVIQQESLLEDLFSSLLKIGITAQMSQIQKLIELPKANTTVRNTDYRSYYNNSSKEAVSILDKEILEKYNYTY